MEMQAHRCTTFQPQNNLHITDQVSKRTLTVMGNSLLPQSNPKTMVVTVYTCQACDTKLRCRALTATLAMDRTQQDYSRPWEAQVTQPAL